MTIIYFILLLSVIICIHELGHLLAAKKFGVYCYEYSFGMGPVIWKKKTDETQYSIRAIPIGGFVSMAGEPDGDEAYPDVVVPEGRRIVDKPTWQRIIILLAGVTMNFLLCFVILSLIILSNGAFAEPPKAVIQTVKADSPAERAGFKDGDVIRTITLREVTTRPETFQDVQVFLADCRDEEIIFEVERGNETVTLSVVPEFDQEYNSYMIGIQAPEYNVVRVNLFNCWYYGAVEMGMIAKMMFEAIRQLVTGKNLNQLSGPVGIYSATEQSVSYGLTSYLFLLAELSLNVGIFNLLPLPILDGGQVVITLGEAAVGKKLNPNVKLAIMGACWVLLIGLMVFVTWNDVSKLFQ